MRNKTLLISIRRLRMLEMDGLGAFARIELAIAKSAQKAKTQPSVEHVSFTLFAPHISVSGKGKSRFSFPGNENGSERRWEAS